MHLRKCTWCRTIKQFSCRRTWSRWSNGCHVADYDYGDPVVVMSQKMIVVIRWVSRYRTWSRWSNGAECYVADHDCGDQVSVMSRKMIVAIKCVSCCKTLRWSSECHVAEYDCGDYDFLSQQNNRLFLFLSELMDLFVAGRDQHD